jgi:hypothetical protein
MTSKKKRIIHSPEFKAETLKLAEKVGVAAGLCCRIQLWSERWLNSSHFKQHTEFRAYLSQLAC